MTKASRPAGQGNIASAIGRALQLLGLVGGSVALVMTFSVMGVPEKSTAPSLGLALICGAGFAVGWLIDRHLGGGRGS